METEDIALQTAGARGDERPRPRPQSRGVAAEVEGAC